MTAGDDVAPASPIGRPTIALVLLATALLAVLGLAGLADKSLSADEIATFRYVSQPPRALARTMLERQANMGLYYLAMAPWVRILDTEVWLRLPSVIAAVATVPALFVLGRRLVGGTAAVVAIYLFATAALVIEHAQTARSYSAATLAVVVATWLFVRAAERPDRRRLALYALAVAAGAYLHFVTVLIVAAHLAALVAMRRTVPWRPMAAAIVAIGILCGPLFAVLVVQDSGQVSWIPALTPDWIGTVLFAAVGDTDGVAAFLAVGLVAGVIAWVRDRDPRLTLVVAWAFLPFVGLVAVSVVKPLLVARFLLPFLPGVALLAGLGIARTAGLWSRGLRLPGIRAGHARLATAAAATAIGVIVGLAAVGGWYERPTPAWRELTDFLARSRGPKDIVLYEAPTGWPPVEYYAARLEPPATIPPRVEAEDLHKHTGRTLWIVVYSLEPPERAVLLERIGADWELSRSSGFDGVSLRRYLPRNLRP